MWGVQGITPEHTGRFPANIILDEEAAEMLDEQSGELKSGSHKKGAKNGSHAAFGKDRSRLNAYNLSTNKGGASRFFYTAKASKSERNAGCEDIEAVKTNDGRKKDADKHYQRGKTLRQNNHPTVKPFKLMEYLCTLTKTPTGGIVLDPFAGSGTTGIACINTKRDYILIEREKEYIPIIEARLKAANKQQTLI